ncbi:metal ABC transporter solute-binding protein, Zn/Mn family, partial [Methanoculleus thermophilus]|uniref:metal ABC transporter solute-binding protein, Zn/Mn family n=1 Tax=Methanoculleus thermophilus TaxID=2200 RepID=UPI001F3920E1
SVEFLERVGGDHVRVIVLVPQGADPHTYEPPPGVLAGVVLLKRWWVLEERESEGPDLEKLEEFRGAAIRRIRE